MAQIWNCCQKLLMEIMPEQTEHHLLHSYLNRVLSPEEEIEFEIAMLQNRNLTEEVVLSHTLKNGLNQSIAAHVPQKKTRVSAASTLFLALAAGLAIWFFMPVTMMGPSSAVSPAIVYLEDYRSHTTEPVSLVFEQGERFKVIVSDAPPAFDKYADAELVDSKGNIIRVQRIKPNENHEITLLLEAAELETGRYQLTLESGAKPLNRFMLDVKKE